MAVRNEKLGGTDYIEENLDNTDMNDTNNAIIDMSAGSYVANARNLIRQLQDRSVEFSADGGEWAEAYTSAGGRLDSVDTGDTTAVFDTNKYTFTMDSPEASGDTTHDPDSFTNPENAFDFDSGTFANKNVSTKGGVNYYLGKTFDEKTVAFVRFYCYGKISHSMAINSVTFRLESYDGSNWNDEQLLGTIDGYATQELTLNSTVMLNKDVEGVRIRCSAGSDDTSSTLAKEFKVYIFDYSSTSGDGLIIHDIPSGTFSATISSTIGIPLFEDWNTDGNIQYKLTNAEPEDSGWLNYNKLQYFTEFTAEPTKLTVKIVPSTTVGYPAIRGFSLYEVK
jgi:hypothetical protein